jgi:hypothetical protein
VTVRTPTGAGEVRGLVGDLLQNVLDAAIPIPGQALGIDQKLSVLFAAIKLFQALKSNPGAGAQALDQSLYDHQGLCQALRGMGTALSQDPANAVLSGLTNLSEALDGHDLHAAEQRFGGLMPRQNFGGTSSGRAGIGGSHYGSATGALGTIGGGGQIYAGAQHQASGTGSIGISGAQAQGQARGSLGIEGEVSGRLNSALLDANARVAADASVYAEASGSGSVNRDGFRASGHAGVGARAQVEVDADFRTAGTTIGGERVDLNGNVHAVAEVSARAEVNADVAATIRPPRALVEIGGEAFAGARAGVEGEVGIGDFMTLSGHAEAWAGAGAEFGVVAGYDDGKLRFGFNMGAALEVGAGAGFGIEIDVMAIANAATGGLAEALLEGGLGMGADELMAHPAGGCFSMAQAMAAAYSQPGDDGASWGQHPQLALLFPPPAFEASSIYEPQAERCIHELEGCLRELRRAG